MYHPKDQKKDHTWADVSKILFIFFAIMIVVIAIQCSGCLEQVPGETTITTLATLPPTTVSTTAATTPLPTTEATTTAVTTTTETTTIETTTVAPKPIYPTDEEMELLIEERLLSIDKNSRPGIKLDSVDGVVVHYIGNAGTSADANWRNFENNKPGASAHFIIGLNGEIIQCIPTDEVAWAVGTEANYTTISIECCHPDKTGKFTDATYKSLVKLVSWLCNKYDLGRDQVLRHYDFDRYNNFGTLWHKECPLYWADADDPNSHRRWESFKDALLLENESS